MTERVGVYKYNIYGNIVEVLNSGIEELVCCGEPMEFLNERTEDVGLEKHVPGFEKKKEGVHAKVGSIPYPKEEKHYIIGIEVIIKGKAYKKFLRPGDGPEAVFKIEADRIIAREYCNFHGIWRFS